MKFCWVEKAKVHLTLMKCMLIKQIFKKMMYLKSIRFQRLSYTKIKLVWKLPSFINIRVKKVRPLFLLKLSQDMYCLKISVFTHLYIHVHNYPITKIELKLEAVCMPPLSARVREERVKWMVLWTVSDTS